METMESTEQAYKWLDGYVFLHSTHSWKQVCGMWQKDEVRYVGRLEKGDDDGDRLAVFVDVDRSNPDAPGELQRRMGKVIAAANPSFSSATAVTTFYGPTRWSTKKTWGAYLRMKAQPGKARQLFEELDPDRKGAPFLRGDSYYGHALCSGDFDVLLELGADSKDRLDALVGRAQSLSGVASSIVSRIKNQITKPPAPAHCEDWIDD